MWNKHLILGREQPKACYTRQRVQEARLAAGRRRPERSATFFPRRAPSVGKRPPMHGSNICKILMESGAAGGRERGNVYLTKCELLQGDSCQHRLNEVRASGTCGSIYPPRNGHRFVSCSVTPALRHAFCSCPRLPLCVSWLRLCTMQDGFALSTWQQE